MRPQDSRRSTAAIRRRKADIAAARTFENMIASADVEDLIARLRDAGHADVAGRIAERRRLDLSVGWWISRAEQILERDAQI